MAPRLSIPWTVTALGVVTIGLGACSGSTPKAASGLASRTTTVANVGVTITPTRIDASGATFQIAFDTHSGAPGIDVAARSTLTVGGIAGNGAAWTGDGPGGHHRAGALRFNANGPARGPVQLDITGLGGSAHATWQLPS